jgi:2-aminoadipate transaminase
MSPALSQLGRRTMEPPISWLMRTALERPGLISLAAGFTDHDSLPVDEAHALLDELLGSPNTGRPALQYGSTVGDPRLRQLTAQRLAELDPATRANYAPDQLLMTHGSQQLLYMVTEALCDPGDIVLVEDPTYFVFLGIMQSHGLCGRGIRLAADGLEVGHLEETLQSLKRSGALPQVKLLYLVTYHQNPTGRTTSFEKKAAALDLLKCYERSAGHPLYLLEDAAYRELRFIGTDIPSALAAAKAGERVIYAGTYSKPFATGARIGFGLLPKPLFKVVARIKGNHDFGTANLIQQLLSRALATGQYAKHLPVLARRYAAKAQVMDQALREHFPAQVQWARPTGGLYFWVRLPRSVKSGSTSPLFSAALASQVLYVPGEMCYVTDPARRKPNHEMRLSFGNASEADIRTGIARLGLVLQQRLARAGD